VPLDTHYTGAGLYFVCECVEASSFSKNLRKSEKKVGND
jgi:hypothetical protein